MNYSLISMAIGLLFFCSCSQPKTNSEPTKKEIKPFYYCAIEMQGSWCQFGNAATQLEEEVKKQNIKVGGETISVWRSYPENTKKENYKWEVGFRVSKDVVVKEPLVLKYWESKNLYSQAYYGPSEGVSDFFKNYWAWFEKNDLKAVRPLLEIEAPRSEIEEGKSKFEALIVAVKKEN